MSESKSAVGSKNTLAEQLKRLRLAKGHMTARGFAKTLGISENRYSRYERGEALPKLDLVLAICDVLKISPNELYGWDPNLSLQAGTDSGTPAQLGFAETSTPARSERQDSPASIDLAAWRLATALTSAAEGSRNSSNGTGSQLGSMRATADLFLQLRRDPLDVVARLLKSPELTNLAPDAEALLVKEITVFLAAISSNDPTPHSIEGPCGSGHGRKLR